MNDQKTTNRLQINFNFDHDRASHREHPEIKLRSRFSVRAEHLAVVFDEDTQPNILSLAEKYVFPIIQFPVRRAWRLVAIEYSDLADMELHRLISQTQVLHEMYGLVEVVVSSTQTIIPNNKYYSQTDFENFRRFLIIRVPTKDDINFLKLMTKHIVHDITEFV